MWSRGYEAVGVAELCAEAGAPRGSFYHWWPSKQALALAMLERAWERVRAEVIMPSFGSPGTLAERIERYAVALERVLREQARSTGCVPGCRFGNFAAELADREPDMRAALARTFEELCACFAVAIGEALDRGEVPADTDPAAAAEALCAHMEGLMILARAHHDPARIRRLSADAIRLLAITPNPEPTPGLGRPARARTRSTDRPPVRRSPS